MPADGTVCEAFFSPSSDGKISLGVGRSVIQLANDTPRLRSGCLTAMEVCVRGTGLDYKIHHAIIARSVLGFCYWKDNWMTKM